MAGAFPEREFGALRSQSRLAKIADARRTDYWGGVTWVFQGSILNAGSGGTHDYTVVPGEGNEFEVLYAQITNRDTASRTAVIWIYDPSGNQIGAMALRTLNAAQSIRAPITEGIGAGGTGGASAGTRFIISGTMQLVGEMISVAANQDSAFAVTARVRGDKPMVTLTGPTGFTPTVNTDEFF